jgi:hypothetical protein
LRQGETALKFIIEVLRQDSGGTLQVLYVFAHTASSIHMVRETMKLVQTSSQWPGNADGFCILSESEIELYRWPEKLR